MRVKNDQTRELILRVAEAEFLEKGFLDSSLRSIAKQAGATTGTIYTYFSSKDDLFEHLVAPVVRKLEAVLASEDTQLSEARERSGFRPEVWFTKNLRFLIRLIDDHPRAMNLLFLKADGSKYHDYKKTLIERGTTRSAKVFKSLKRSREFKGQELSTFFVRNLAAYVITAATEMIRQRSSKENIERYEAEITAFLFSGWKALVEITL